MSNTRIYIYIYIYIHTHIYTHTHNIPEAITFRLRIHMLRRHRSKHCLGVIVPARMRAHICGNLLGAHEHASHMSTQHNLYNARLQQLSIPVYGCMYLHTLVRVRIRKYMHNIRKYAHFVMQGLRLITILGNSFSEYQIRILSPRKEA